jgi:hypothetical protein
MPIQFDNFDQQKIERLKNHLVAMAGKGKAKFYEIFVDSLKAVPKTDEPNEFDGYEDYMTADTEQIKILIYNSDASPRNDQYVFLMKAKSREDAIMQGLSGLPGKTYSRASVDAWREQQNKKTIESLENQRLKSEIKELNEELEDRDKQIGELVKLVEEAKSNGNKLGGVHLGDIMSVALEGIVRRNTHLLTQIPGVNGLAGIIERDNERLAVAGNQPDTAVTFRKKEQLPGVSEQDREFINLFRELQRHFSDAEMGQVMELLDALSRDKSLLQEISEQLKEEKEQ